MNLRQAAQQAFEVLLEYQPNPCLIPETQEETDRAEAFWDAIDALRAALAEPQTTHWEGCEAVHPECKTEHEVKDLSNYEFKTYNIGGFHLGEGFYSAAELREMVKEFDAMDAAAKRSMRRMK